MKLYLLLTLFLRPSVVGAADAGFDCRKAYSWAEKSICASPDLGGLDQILNKAFQGKLKDKNADRIKKDQKAWIKKRNQCEHSIAPVEAENCLHVVYLERLKDLGSVDEVLGFYRAQCKKNYMGCTSASKLDYELARWDDAVRDLGDFCNKDQDDVGESCFFRAKALEKLGKKPEALEQAKSECEKRHHNEACAMVYRLNGKKSANSWVGLYRNQTGTLWVQEAADGNIYMTADTWWTNGHSCGWNLQGKIQGDHLAAQKDPQVAECAPVVKKKGAKIIVEDPHWNCKNFYCAERALYEGTFELDPQSVP